jgi:transcription factor STE12
MSMYPQQGAAMAPPQKPETFMLSNEAQQSLPQDAQVALQQVDNCECLILSRGQSRAFENAYTGIQ